MAAASASTLHRSGLVSLTQGYALVTIWLCPFPEYPVRMIGVSHIAVFAMFALYQI